MRKGRERGCWVYIAWEQLEECGFARDEPPPWYQTWPDSGGRPRLMVNLYRDEPMSGGAL